MIISMRRKRSIVALASVVIALLAVPVVPVARADSPVLSPDTSHFGKTYSEWSAAWWEWALSISVHSPPFSSHINHPLFDLTGVQCGEGQNGPVWFLGGAFFVAGTPALSTIVRNECIVPANKALYFPILNTECSFLEGGAFGCPGTTVDELREDIKNIIDLVANLSADVDGVSIPITSNFRTVSGPFSFTLPKDNVLSEIGEGPFAAGTYFPSVDDGFYVMLAPLPKGVHQVHFHGEIPDFAFTLDVTYNLTVGR
jgi:hypothetical protein